jgi:hypothetical protein
MRSRVPTALVLAPWLLFAAVPAQAAEGVVLVGCDLFSNGGPRVDFVQSHGVSKKNGKAKRQLFVSGSGFRSNDFEGRPCSEVLSEVVDDGLVFKAMNVFGQDQELALWFFEED